MLRTVTTLPQSPADGKIRPIVFAADIIYYGISKETSWLYLGFFGQFDARV
jgi:hypothetical protein